jgi:hypothetical protein
MKYTTNGDLLWGSTQSKHQVKFLNDRKAQVMADRLGVTIKTLEREYGFTIVKDGKINNMHWEECEEDELFYEMQDFLTDHPNYVAFLNIFGIDKYTKIRAALDVRQIAEVFQHIFDARLSFNDKDRPEVTDGYFIRTEQYSLVAISAMQWGDGCKRSQSATVIHEFGHYVEQRIIPDNVYLPNQPYNDRDTSFAAALLLLSQLNLGIDSKNQRLMADELVAWINAIWISWIVGLDPRTAVLGAAIDTAVQKKFAHTEVIKRIFEPLAIMVCSKKHAVEFFNRFGQYDLSQMSKYNPSEMGDKSLCLQIEQATRLSIDMIRAHS